MITTYFDIIKVNGRQTHGELLISPLNAYCLSYSGSIVGQQTVCLYDECNATGATIQLVPATYTCRLNGYNAETTFLIDLSLVADGSSVTASNYLVNYNNMYNNHNTTASFALYSGTASQSQLALSLPTFTQNGTTSGIGVNMNISEYPWACLVVNGDIVDQNENYKIAGTGDGTNTSWIGTSGALLGINNTSPAYQLDVVGTINFTGLLLHNGSSYISPTASLAQSLQLYDSGLGRNVTVTSVNGILQVI